MVSDPIAQWVLTVVFAVLALYSACRIFIDRRRPLQAFGHVLHNVMALDMAAMAWPWWMALPALPQIIVFGFSTAWYLTLLILQLSKTIHRRVLGGHSGWHQAMHALMMLAMVWMVIAMHPGDGSVGTPPASDAASHAHAYGVLPEWSLLIGVVLTAVLLVAAVILLVESMDCIRGTKLTCGGRLGDVTSDAAMNLGMATTCWLMVVAP